MSRYGMDCFSIQKLPVAVRAGSVYLFKEQVRKLLTTVIDSQTVCRINDPDQCVRLFKIVLPV